jgi:DNA-binding NtrC family response regulator
MSIRVLITDDEARFRTSLARVLSRRGFIVRSCGSGEDALAILAKEPCDVVVLDLRMPGMDGLATLAEIRRHTPLLPVLLLSGMADLPSVSSALAQGVTNFLAKPCAIETLISAIEDAHEERGLSDRCRDSLPDGPGPPL